MWNKKGEGDMVGDFVLFFKFAFFLVIIGVGIALGILLFFGPGIDARQVDADLLNSKIEECLAENGKGILGDEDRFFEACKLEKSVFGNDKYIFRICDAKKDEKDCLKSGRGLVSVGSNFVSCTFEGVREGEAFAKCSLERVSVQGEEYVIVTGSNQRNRRISE